MFLEEFISVYCTEKLYTLGLQLPTSVDYCCVPEMCSDVNTACSSGPSGGQQLWCCWSISGLAALSDSKPCPNQAAFCNLALLATTLIFTQGTANTNVFVCCSVVISDSAW